MSVRIHQLSKDIGMGNKELLQLLQERGYAVKTAASGVDNITAESLREEFRRKAESEGSEAEPDAPASRAGGGAEHGGSGADAPAAPEAPAEGSGAASEAARETAPAASETGTSFPEGAVVRSPEELERERREKAEANKPKPPPQPSAQQAPPPPSAAPGEGSEPPPAASSRSGSSAPPPPPPPPPSAAGGPPKPPPRPGSAASGVSSAPSENESPAAEEQEGDASGAEESAEATGGESDEGAAKAPLRVKPPIVVRDFAKELGLKPFKLISELMEMGIFASMNQTIEESVARQMAERHGFELEVQHRGQGQAPGAAAETKPPEEDVSKFVEPRPPVVCILGHVDHGKTTLLDAVRKANVVGGEAGGITQHIGAYQVEHNGHRITFIDTPGHAAFSTMRERGANVTDIAILVVAADDGFMPQTEEALRFAKTAQNAVVVAINKTDARGANIDRVKQQMQEKGLQPEDLGGETLTVPVSALKGENLEDLLEHVVLQAEIMELKANPKAPVSGTVIESQIEQGKGAVATLLVEEGTLKTGQALVCGEAFCKVRSMFDDSGEVVKAASPGTPVRVIGWSDPPASGDKFRAEKNERHAKRAADEAAEARKRETMGTPPEERGAATVDDLFQAIESARKQSLRVIVKADVHGAAEALASNLKAVESPKVDLEIVSRGVGNVAKNDVTMAAASGAAIVGFNVRLDQGVQGEAKHQGVQIYQHNIIYELVNIVEDAMAELLETEKHEKKLGLAEVRQVFSIGKNRRVAGCMVTEGSIVRGGKARVLRDGATVHESSIDTLKRFQDDAKDVRAGYECGINVRGMDSYREGDTIECFEIEEVRPSLR